MAAWVERSLAESMATLKSVGRGHLADELDRILHIVKNSADVHWFREQSTQGLLEDIYLMQYSSDCTEILNRWRTVFDVEHCALFRLTARTEGENRLLFSTYPDEWVSEYKNNGYLYLDPYLGFAMETGNAFFWNEVSVEAPVSIQMLEKASVRGIGPAGFSFVAPVGQGDLIVIAMSSRQQPAQFRLDFQRKLDDVSAACEHLVETLRVISRREETWRRGSDDSEHDPEPKTSNSNVIWPSSSSWANVSRNGMLSGL